MLYDSEFKLFLGIRVYTNKSLSERMPVSTHAVRSIATLTFSSRLYDLFPSLEAIYNSSLNEYQIFTVGGSVIQETKSLYAWYDIKSILLISSDLPISKQSFQATGNFNSLKINIINEFIPLYDSSTNIERSDWVFESNQFRTLDMTSSEEIKSFSFDITLTTKYGKRVEYRLAPNESATITFRFMKKAIFNNEWNITNMDERIKQNPNLNFHRR